MRKPHTGTSLAILLMAGAMGAAYGADYTPVTDARLQNPEPENWLMTRGNYAGWSYSPLAQINTSNVKNLVPVWSVSTGVTSGHEAPPIVNNGVMFVATPYSQVLALDAATGDMLWRYQRKLPEGFAALHNTSRGVGLYGDKVFFPTLDATLVALDAKTGKVDWEAKVEDWKQGYYMTMAPLVVKGKVLVGVAGGEFGVRGFVEAFDAETGKSAWKTYTIPAPGEPGSETWEKPDTWKTGGASTWMTGNYDPATNTVYWGTGNGSPWFGDQRPGDNLYTSSTVALDGDTGKIKGHFQYHQNEVLGLGCYECADAGRFPEGGRDDEGPTFAAAQRLHLLARPQRRRQHFLPGLRGLRSAERLQEHRPQDGPTRRRPRPQTGNRQGRAVLPRVVGRKGLAIRGL